MTKVLDKNKFRDSWYRKLTPKQKCIWEFLVYECTGKELDELDLESMSFHIGEKVEKEEVKFFDCVFMENGLAKEPKRRKMSLEVSKDSYGEFKKVKLTKEEYEKLFDIYKDVVLLKKGIDKLDSYIESSGKKYKSHYAVLGKHNWVYKQIVGDMRSSRDGVSIGNIMNANLRG